jgi:hypothetical protein
MGGKRRNLSEFQRLSAKKFGAGVFKLDEFNYIDMKTKGVIVCPVGHRYAVSPAAHLRGDGGCKECKNAKVGKRFSDTPEEWRRKSREKHGEAYGYEKSDYRGQREKVIITCRSCNTDFEQNPTSHVQGCGCPRCGIEKSRNAKFLTDAEIREMVEACSALHAIHYAYVSSFLDDGRVFINLECPKHGPFSQRLDHHRKGHGCVHCCSSVSRSEEEWIAYLGRAYGGHLFLRQYKVPSTSYVADAYCEELNRMFEYDGDFWHGNPSIYNSSAVNPRTGTTFGDLYERTLQKRAVYEKLGYNLTTIWGADWERAKLAIVEIQRAFRSKRSK